MSSLKTLETSSDSSDLIVTVSPRFDATVKVIVINSAGALATWSPQPGRMLEVVREIVVALVRERSSLAFQLSHAKGLIDDEEYETTIDEYLWDARHVPGLEQKALMFFDLAPDLVDAELVSTVFRCDLLDAEQALRNVARQVRFPFATLGDSLKAALAESAREGR